MKKTLLLLASTALLLVGCAKEQVGPAAGDGEMVEVDITAGTAELTKAAIDHDGQAAYVTRWIMEVRDGSGDVYSRKVDTEDAGTLQHTFNIKLFKNQQYTFAFWADNGGEFYDASDLSAVKYVDGKAFVAGVDAKDAFSGVETLTFSESISRTITLYRPFAQLNVITKDLKDLRADAISDDAYNAFKPKNFKATITVPTQFNVLSGEASEEIELILSADEFYGKDPLSYEKAPAQATMFMAYIFATKGEKDIRTVNFKFDVDSQTGNNTFDFTDVPFQRNYRTNILGNFLSGDAEWTVKIDTVWCGEYDYPPFEAGSIAEANESLEAGETNISISNPSDYASVDLTIPAVANGKDLIIEVADNAGMELKVDASNSTPKSISLAAVKARSLNIDAPASHVELTAGEYTESVEASTSATTLVVGKNTTINTLKIKQGNAVIDGNVTTFVNETGAALVWNVASTVELANAVKFAGEGDEIKLAAGDYAMPAAISKEGIKITGEGGVLVDCPATCTISASGVVLKNLTVKCNPSNGSTSGTWNITKKATLENITFTENSTKIVVVSGSEQVDFKGCRFENKGKGRAIMVWGGSPKIDVDGCYFDNVYPFNVDGGSPVFTVKNSQLNGWTSYGGTTTATFEGCDFGKSTSGYAYCRPYRNTVFEKCNFSEGYLIDFGAAGVEIDLNECKLNGQPMTIAILDLAELSHAGVLRINNQEVFPITTFEVSTVNGLKSAITCVNDIKREGKYTIILADGTYEASDMVVAQNFAGKSVVIKAANSKAAVLKLNEKTETKQIFLIHGGSNYDETRAITFEGIKFELPGTIVGNDAAGAIYAMMQSDPLCDAIKWPKNNDTRYAHNVTAIDCELVGKSGKKVSDSDNDNTALFYSQSATDAKNFKAVNCVIKNAGYLANIYASGVEAVNCVTTNCKDFINNQTAGVTVTGCTVECTSDYGIRTNGGPLVVTNNTFNMTYSGSATEAGVVVLRGTSTEKSPVCLEATISGNTFTKASQSMWDCYCKTAWTVNGEDKTAGTGINF